MRKLAVYCCLLTFPLLCGHTVTAQDTPKAPEAAKTAEPPIHYFRMEFVIQEVGTDGKPTNSRSYSTTVTTEPHSRSSIRTGSRIPIVTGAYPDNNDKRGQMQFQYLDVGVNIDVLGTREVSRQLALDLKAEVSSLAGSPSPSAATDPVIRQNYWQSAVLIPVGKSTVVFTSDALESKGGMQISVTATPLQ
ncbi:MAG TPA: hypothetical protein VGL00_19145 [Terracidiphilus sp.]|jgi:hypothetical protein